jgi:hypothetical protein
LCSLTRVFVPDKPFQSSLMFAGKAGAYPSEATSDATLKGRLLALPTNNILGWKGPARDKHWGLVGPFVSCTLAGLLQRYSLSLLELLD